jgi:hypothetical protein
MTDDIRRDGDRTDELDRHDRQVVDEPVERRDIDLDDTGHRPIERDAEPRDADDRREGSGDVRDAESVRTESAVADDTIRADTAAAEPVATDRAVAAEGDAARTRDPVDDRDTHRDPTSERRPAAGPGTTTTWSEDGLLSTDDRGSYQQRWDDIQVRFIDEPRQCVREADDLVGEVTTRISERFSGARQDMEQRWDGGNEPTTEELRQAVQRYRDFFQRLVAQ